MNKLFLTLLLALGAFVSFSSPAFAQQTPAPASPDQTWGEWLSGWVTEEDESDTRKSLSEWQQTFSDPGSCWGCTLFSNMASVTLEVGQQGESMFTGGAIAAMNAFMGLWVVWQLFLLMSPSHAHSPAQTIDTIFQRLVLMMVVLWVLSSGPFNLIMTGFVFPTLASVMSTAGQLIPGGGGSCGGGGGDLVGSGTGLMCSMHVEMGRGLGLGAFLIDDADFNVFLGRFEIFQAAGGLIIFLAFGMMMILLPFRLFDAMIRLAVVSVILPVCVLAYQFKPTRGATKQAATSVLAAGLTFLFTAVAVAVAVGLLQRVTTPVLDAVSDGSANSFVGPLSGSQFMVLVAAAVGMAAFIKQAGSIAAEFAGFQGQMGNVGGAGAAAAGGAIATAGAGVAYGGARLAGVGGHAVGRAMGAGARSATSRIGGGGEKGAGVGQAEMAPR